LQWFGVAVVMEQRTMWLMVEVVAVLQWELLM
jgi:hypothetical protein